MKGRKQKISQDSYLQKNRTEPEGYVGAQTSMWITENNLTSLEQTGYGMLEQTLSPANLNAAYKRVKQNKGAGGIDEMQVESLKDYLIKEKDALIATILDGNFAQSVCNYSFNKILRLLKGLIFFHLQNVH